MAELNSDNYSSVPKDSDILTTDKKAAKEAAENTKVEEAKRETKENIEKLIDAGILEDKGNGKYYSKKYDSYYKIDKNGELYNITKRRLANIDVMLDAAEKAESEKPKPLDDRETDAKSSGVTFRKKLVNGTSGSQYVTAEKILRSFFVTENAESIYDFIDGYYTEKWDGTDWDLMSYNSRFAAQIASEDGWSKEKKIGFIKKIAEQTEKLAKKAGIDPDDDIFDDLREIKESGTVDGNWFSNRGARNWWRGLGGLAGLGGLNINRLIKEGFQGFDLLKTARIMDSIIIDVKKKYEEKICMTETKDNKKSEDSEEA